MASIFEPKVLRNDPNRRAVVIDLLTAALDRVDPYRAVERTINEHPELLDRSDHPDGRLIVLAFGKAAPAMARAIGDAVRVDAGTVVSNHLEPVPPPLELMVSGHPLPDERSVAAARRLLGLAREATERDLVVCLISGGGSSLAELPAPGLTLADVRSTVDLLLNSGARIEEINTVRSHLSAFKGGRLAEAIGSAATVTLILSDVVGNPLPFIASGPTVPDPTTYADALDILTHQALLNTVPQRVVDHLVYGAQGDRPETPKSPFPNQRIFIVADGASAAEGAQTAAENLGLTASIATTTLTGKARDAARLCLDQANTGITIFAGETTVHVDAGGTGGRNQEAALAAALAIRGRNNVVFVAFATDGVDGPTDAAGAIIDGATVGRGLSQDLDAVAALAAHDSYPYLDATGDLLRCGPTGTNVGDLWMVWQW